MNKFVIIHDKLINYGGAEAVILSLVRQKSPLAIVCSCVSNRSRWEELFGVPVLSPIMTRFITSEFLFKLFYPYVVVVCMSSKLLTEYRDMFFFVYSSSAGKYFRGYDFSNSLLYINYHAKGVASARKYLSARWMLYVGWIVSFLGSLFLYFENSSLLKFKCIRAISHDAFDSLPLSVRNNPNFDLGVLHCPVRSVEVISSQSHSIDLPSEYYVIVSRLTPEKAIEPILDFIQNETDFHVVIVGDGNLLESFRRKYNDRFVFVGFVDALLKDFIISKSLAVIQPTAQEWSLVTVESNTLGIPVISVRSRGLEEINVTISGRPSFPNLLFDVLDDLPRCFTQIDGSASFLRRNKSEIAFLFSGELFSRRICLLANSLSVKSVPI